MSGEFLLFATIWVATLLFVAGEVGKRLRASGKGAEWAWNAWAAGTILCAAHMVLSLGMRHGWSHRAALEATALQTEAVYGVSFGTGLYVNYVFLGVWIGETVWWRRNPRAYSNRSAAITWALRLFYFVVLVNAAVIFARHWAPGAVLMSILIWSWTVPHRGVRFALPMDRRSKP